MTMYSDTMQKWIKRQLKHLSNNEYYVFRILADYRPHNLHKPDYYVIAKSKREAKIKFTQRISWLKIYECIMCEIEIAQKIVSHPDQYIVF